MPVHVNGRVVIWTRFGFSTKIQSLVVEDAAQAMGAKLDGKSAGAFGEWGTFSFYPSNTWYFWRRRCAGN